MSSIYEYSQTKLFNIEDNKTLVQIIPDNYSTGFIFTNRIIGKKFVKVIESWDLFGPSFAMEEDTITYYTSQNGSDAYEYSKFMSLMISFFEGDLKERVIK